MKKRFGVKGVSPVVATVLLVAIVIIIALIIFLWFKNIGGETCTKFQGKNIKLVCSDVEFFADYESNTGILTISNTGNVPLFNMGVRINRVGNYDTQEITDFAGGNWPPLGLNSGKIYSSGDISGDLSGADSLILTPVLRSSCGGNEKSYMCDDNKHGYEIPIF